MIGDSSPLHFMKLWLTLALALAVTSSHGFAKPRIEEGLRSDEIDKLGPIGSVFSFGSVLVDNRAVAGESALWGGERLWARDASASVRLNGVGRVTLFTGGVASLTTSVVDDTGANGPSILIIVVQAGEAAISLEAGASARVEVSGARFRASPGSKFGVHVVEGKGILSVGRGEVTKEPEQSQPGYTLTGAKLNKKTGVWSKSYQKKFQIEVNKDLQIPVIAEEPKLRTPNKPRQTRLASLMLIPIQAAPGNHQAIGVGVKFCLTANAPPGWLGQPGGICETAITDSNGFASVVFHAGPDKGSTGITAIVLAPGGGSWEGEIEVLKPAGFLRPRNIAIMAAAAAGTICLFKCRDSGPGPLKQVPPPVIP